MPPDPISEAVRLVEADIADFEARMREVTPAYQRGDRVELHGEVFEVSSCQPEGMPGYWLRGETEKLFWPMDLESLLRPVVHEAAPPATSDSPGIGAGYRCHPLPVVSPIVSPPPAEGARRPLGHSPVQAGWNGLLLRLCTASGVPESPDEPEGGAHHGVYDHRS